MSILKLNKGFVFGLLLLASALNLTAGLIFILIYSLFVHFNAIPRGRYAVIPYLLALKAVWIIGVDIVLSDRTFYHSLANISSDVIILLFLFVRVNSDFLKNTLLLVVSLFFVDIVFNFTTLLFGVDPLGRAVGARPDDILPRMGGVMGHPFYSVNISLLGMIAGIYLSNKKIIYLSVIALAINGTFRSPLILILLGVIYFLHVQSFRFYAKLIVYITFIAIVFIITALSGLIAVDESGNFLRLLAWDNAIRNIYENPLFGTHTFLSGSFDVMSADTIIDYGIAESMHLQVALDYGILPAVITILVLSIIMIQADSVYSSTAGKNHQVFASSVMASVMFVDSFYGTAYGSVLVTFIFVLLCISLKDIHSH